MVGCLVRHPDELLVVVLAVLGVVPIALSNHFLSVYQEGIKTWTTGQMAWLQTL